MALQETQRLSNQSVFAGLFAPAIAPSTAPTDRSEMFAREMDRANDRDKSPVRDTRPVIRERVDRNDSNTRATNDTREKSLHNDKIADQTKVSDKPERSEQVNKSKTHSPQENERAASRNSEAEIRVSADSQIGNSDKALLSNKIVHSNLIQTELAAAIVAESQTQTADVSSSMFENTSDEIVQPNLTKQSELNSALSAYVSQKTDASPGAQNVLVGGKAALNALTAIRAKTATLNDETDTLLAVDLESADGADGRRTSGVRAVSDSRVLELSLSQNSDVRAMLNALNNAQNNVALQAQRLKTQQHAEKGTESEKTSIRAQDGLPDDQLLIKPQVNQNGSNLNPVAQMTEALKLQAESAASKAQDIELASANNNARSQADYAGLFKSELSTNTPGKTVSTPSAKVIIPENFGAFVKGKTNSITLKISPAHLGEAKLSVSVRKHQVHGALLVESMAAKSAVESSLDKLVERLAQEGLQLDQLDVEVSGDQWRDNYQSARQGRSYHSGRRFSLETESEVTPATDGTGISAAQASNVVNAYGVNAFA